VLKNREARRARGRGDREIVFPGWGFARRAFARAAICAAVCAGVYGGATPRPAVAQTVPPDDPYLTLTTEHFRVTFPRGLEAIAQKAAASAERAHALLSADFLPPPRGPIDLLISDSADLSNGTAEVFPSNRMAIWVHPPLEGLALSQYDDWVELVITHELTHVFQLDHGGTLSRLTRSVFGRLPWTWPGFPGQGASQLGIEGVAVHLESRYTDGGRIRGTFYEAVARTQVLAGRSERIDQGLGRSPRWPGGDRPYVLGSLFFEDLAASYGEAAVARFFDALSDQWIPYRLNSAAREAFGSSFDDLWEDWAMRLVAEASERRGGTPVEIVAGDGYLSLYPTVGPGGVAFARADGRSDVALVRLGNDGERTVLRWNSLERPTWLADGSILAPQLEHTDRYRVRRDLYRVAPDGEVSPITSGLRVVHASASPTGSEIVAVLAEGDTNRLAVLSVDGTVERVLADPRPGVLWSFPAWSPDGGRIAVSRHRAGGWTSIVIFDVASGAAFTPIEERSLNVAPTWTPGGEGVIWSSDRSGTANLYGMALEGLGPAGGPAGLIRQITDLATAGTFPAVDPTGTWIYLSVLGPDGWSIGRVPLDPDSWFDPRQVDPRYAVGVPGPDAGSVPQDSPPAPAGGEVADYSALRTVLPRYWEPVRFESHEVLGTRVLPSAWGARTSGWDIAERHLYRLSFASAWVGEHRPEWDARYTWAGLGNPHVTLETGQEWDSGGPSAVPREDDEAVADTLMPVLRERWAGGSVELRRQRMRYGASFGAGAQVVSLHRRVVGLEGRDESTFEFPHPESELFEGRLAASFSSARAHDFSVSLQDGVRVSAAVRQRWDYSVPDTLAGREGADEALREALLTFEGYRSVGGPGYAPHVLALRLSGGVASGPGAGPGHFSVGGESGSGSGLLGFAVGSGFRRFPVRGLSVGSLYGSRAWAVSGEWRFPLGFVDRGLGAWPVYLDRLAGSVFVDVAGADSEAEGDSAWRTVSAAGLEVVLTHSLLFEALDRLRVGVAFPLEPTPEGSRNPSVYVQTGWSF
jgi:hypothetical protein